MAADEKLIPELCYDLKGEDCTPIFDQDLWTSSEWSIIAGGLEHLRNREGCLYLYGEVWTRLNNAKVAFWRETIDWGGSALRKGAYDDERDAILLYSGGATTATVVHEAAHAYLGRGGHDEEFESVFEPCKP